MQSVTPHLLAAFLAGCEILELDFATVVSAGAAAVGRTSWVGTVLLHAEILNFKGIHIGARVLTLGHLRVIAEFRITAERLTAALMTDVEILGLDLAAVVSGVSEEVRNSWVGALLLPAKVFNLDGILLGASSLAVELFPWFALFASPTVDLGAAVFAKSEILELDFAPGVVP